MPALCVGQPCHYDPEGRHQTLSAMYPTLNSFKPCDLPTLLSSLHAITPLLDSLTDVGSSQPMPTSRIPSRSK